uniref:Uncharacterized protein n=1 Tax=Anguilla anguilla TaxID=7936 RepID=A0A0E9WCE7_ANGAN
MAGAVALLGPCGLKLGNRLQVTPNQVLQQSYAFTGHTYTTY